MHGYETMMAPTEATAPQGGEPDGVGPAPVQRGDFAAGLRTRPLDAGACGRFATGMTGSFTRAARAIGDFASRTQSHAGPRVIGDFATGMRARGGRRLAHAADRPRSDRERREAGWASA